MIVSIVFFAIDSLEACSMIEIEEQPESQPRTPMPASRRPVTEL